MNVNLFKIDPNKDIFHLRDQISDVEILQNAGFYITVGLLLCDFPISVRNRKSNRYCIVVDFEACHY